MYFDEYTIAVKRGLGTVLHWDESADFLQLESVCYNIKYIKKKTPNNPTQR